MPDTPPIIKEVKVKGGQLLDKVREIIDEGNARRIIIKNDERTLFEIPMMAGVGGAAAAVLFAPALAAIGAIAALVTDVSVIVEHDSNKDGVAESSTTVFGKGSDSGSKSASGSGSGSSSSTSGASSKSDGGDSGSSNSGKTMGGESKS